MRRVRNVATCGMRILKHFVNARASMPHRTTRTLNGFLKYQPLFGSSNAVDISDMEPYGIYLVALGILNGALLYHRFHAEKQETVEDSLALPSGENKAAATRFKWEYFSLYSLVMAADWLQVR